MLWIVATALAADPAAGARIFAGSCTACHGTAGDGNGPAAATMKPPPANFTEPAFWKDRTDERIAEAIRAGRPDTAMLPVTDLTDADIADLTAYLHSLATSAAVPTP